VLPQTPDALWQLERIGADLFSGWCRNGAPTRVFGGQVAAQALAAAGADLPEDWAPASLHVYFAREGRSADAIDYLVTQVDERFRRVTAIQGGRPILTLDTAFEPVTEPLPPAPGGFDTGDAGDELAGWAPRSADEARWLAEQAERIRFELRFPDLPTRFAGRSGVAQSGQTFWLRATGPVPDRPLQHACGLTYVSDLMLVSTALANHGLPGHRHDVQAASLDHAVWFHRPARVDEWIRYDQDSPTSAGSRGLSRGRLFNRAGELVATVHQEVLMRVPAP
jgi:acyl-CoA thioesterase-2